MSRGVRPVATAYGCCAPVGRGAAVLFPDMFPRLLVAANISPYRPLYVPRRQTLDFPKKKAANCMLLAAFVSANGGEIGI